MPPFLMPVTDKCPPTGGFLLPCVDLVGDCLTSQAARHRGQRIPSLTSSTVSRHRRGPWHFAPLFLVHWSLLANELKRVILRSGVGSPAISAMGA